MQGACTVKKQKFADVDNLLKKHFGEAWENDPSSSCYKETLEKRDKLEYGDRNLVDEEETFLRST